MAEEVDLLASVAQPGEAWDQGDIVEDVYFAAFDKKIGETAGHVADFSCVTALPVAEVKAEAKRVATLRSSWREQLPARYSAFMARVGTDDFKEEALAGEIERLVDAVVSG